MLHIAVDELGLPTLTKRDKIANDMMYAFDFDRGPRQSCVLHKRSCKLAMQYNNPNYYD